jgi:hypothetical protein
MLSTRPCRLQVLFAPADFEHGMRQQGEAPTAPGSARGHCPGLLDGPPVPSPAWVKRSDGNQFLIFRSDLCKLTPARWHPDGTSSPTPHVRCPANTGRGDSNTGNLGAAYGLEGVFGCGPDTGRGLRKSAWRPCTNPLHGIGAAGELYPAPEPPMKQSKVGALPQIFF